MKYSFAELGNQLLSRKFGGTTTGVANPLLSGYFFIWIENIPTALLQYTAEGGSGISSTSEIQNILAASCIGVTPPGGTLNAVDFTGLGGVKWTVPSNIDYGNTVSTKHIEFENTPILDIYHGWIKMIRDYRMGITDVLESYDDGSGNSKATYACTIYYWTTTPDGKYVQYYACYDGCFPKKDPQDLYSGDVETVGRIDVEQEWNLDYAYHEPWVKDKCQSYADGFAGMKDVIKGYGPQ